MSSIRLHRQLSVTPASEVIGKEMAELIIPPSLREQHRRGLARYLSIGEGRSWGSGLKLLACVLMVLSFL